MSNLSFPAREAIHGRESPEKLLLSGVLFLCVRKDVVSLLWVLPRLKPQTRPLYCAPPTLHPREHRLGP